MKTVLIGGDVWKIQRVPHNDASLVDRTGHIRLATTDPITRTISISANVGAPLLDRVLLHEVAHAVTVSYGLLDYLRQNIPRELWVLVEEWAAELMELHSIEVAIIASQALGRPTCSNGFCTS